MEYSVRKLARLACVSVRTLHYYDEIDLLRPKRDPRNGYRVYDQSALLRLQQILFLRELGIRLEDIRAFLDTPNFNLPGALELHRSALLERREQLDRLLQTVDNTIQFLKGNAIMEDKELFKGFSAEEEKRYTEEARQAWGDTHEFSQSMRLWGSYSEEKKASILEEGNAIYRDVVAAMPFGAESPQVQACIARWHQHLCYFYEPSTEMLLGLADLYNENPDFAANFRRVHPDLSEFMRRAIQVYCKGL